MSRFFRIGLSFAIVLVAYWAYALVAVPWIEPAADPRRDDEVSLEELEKARKAAQNDPRRRMLEPLFSPGDWELGERTKILESEQVRLLVEDWDTLEGNQVVLRPCTMIFTPHGDGSEAERIRQSIVLQAPQGARLRFDQPLDLRRGNIGRLVAGSMAGAITIRSQGKLPGPQDDLWVVTRDLELNEQGIWTDHDVQFRFGPNFGRGANLQVKFLPSERGTAGSHGLNVGGIESFTLRHLEQLHLESGHAGVPLADESRPSPGGPRSIVLEVKCSGPFRFDLGQQLATFEDRVDVRRINPQGPADQVSCELLGIHFARRRADAAKGEPATAEKSRPVAFDLQPRRIEARGHPVTVEAPSEDAQARGELLEYDLLAGKIALRPYPGSEPAPGGAAGGAPEVFLRQGASEIHAPAVEYQLAEPGRLGQATAQGPGWLKAEVKDRPGQPLLARWNQELRIRPQDREHVISLTGGAELGYGGFGGLSAAEIHFWLFEVPPARKGDRPQVRPDRMLARQQVRLNATQLSGQVDQLEVWFEQQPASPGGEQPPMVPVTRADPRLDSMRMAMEMGSRIPSALHTVWRPMNQVGQRLGLGGPEAGRTSPSVPAVTRSSDSSIGRHFDITGRLLRARVVTVGNDSDVAELMVEGKVRFAETRTAKPEDKPLVVLGDRVHVLDAAQAYAAATVTGSPAHFEARGLGLTGSNINVNRGTSRVWIEGPGRLDLVLDRDFEGRPVPQGLPVLIQWREGMRVEGRSVQFEESVVVTSRQQHLRTDTLEISFKEPLQFSDPSARPRPELERLRCRGGVILENRSADEEGQTSFERIEAQDLAIHAVTGAMNAGGPGRVMSVRRGSAEALLDLDRGENAAAKPPGSPIPVAGERARETKPGDGPDSKRSLSCLDVRFQREITGNFQQRRMTFRDQVQAVFGPVPTWESTLPTDQPESLGPRGGELRCDQLSVVQMPGATAGRRNLELEAVGNTWVQGQQFTARGHRITYAEAKDLLVFEGDGRALAQLYRQTQVGGAVTPLSAQRILYRRSTGDVYVDGFRAMEHQIPAAPPK